VLIKTHQLRILLFILESGFLTAASLQIMLNPRVTLLVNFIHTYKQERRRRKKNCQISEALWQCFAKPNPINNQLKYNFVLLVVWGDWLERGL